MIAATYISSVLLPLAPLDRVEDGLLRMENLQVQHLPIVDSDSHLLGMVSEAQLLNESDPDRPVSYVIRDLPVSAKPQVHLYEVAKMMLDHDLSTLPIADESEHFYGMIARNELFEVFSQLLNVQQQGAIIVLETHVRDYSPAQITHVLEQHKVKLLSLAQHESAHGLYITLKLETRDTSRVRHVLEHHGYRIVGDFGEEETDEDLQRRADEFLRYLEV